MRHIIAGLVFLVVANAASGQPPSFAYWAEWGVNDEEGELIIQLRANGQCSVYLADRRTAVERRVECTYWVHGGRVRLRARGEASGHGFNALEIEHLRYADTLVILGDRPRVLARKFGEKAA